MIRNTRTLMAWRDRQRWKVSRGHGGPRKPTLTFNERAITLFDFARKAMGFFHQGLDPYIEIIMWSASHLPVLFQRVVRVTADQVDYVYSIWQFKVGCHRN